MYIWYGVYAKHKIPNPIVERLILIRIVYQFNYRNIRNIYSKAVKSLRGYNILPFVPAILMCAVPCRLYYFNVNCPYFLA